MGFTETVVSAVFVGTAPAGSTEDFSASGGEGVVAGGLGAGGLSLGAAVDAGFGAAVDEAGGGPALAPAGVGAGAGFFLAAASANRASTSAASIG